MLREEDIRLADFSFAGTKILGNGETDIFRPFALDGVEIHVLLLRIPERQHEKSMTYESIEFVDSKGQPVAITGEDGSPMDRELSQVMAWEIVEGDMSRTNEYSYGRAPAVREDGTPAEAGEFIAARFEDEAPSFAF